MERDGKIQIKLLQCVLGHPNCSRSKPLLQTLQMETISESVDKQSLNLYRSCLLSRSGTIDFYNYVSFK